MFKPKMRLIRELKESIDLGVRAATKAGSSLMRERCSGCMSVGCKLSPWDRPRMMSQLGWAAPGGVMGAVREPSQFLTIN